LEAQLKDKVAIITGATSGIGAATAKLFAKHGAKVVVNGLNSNRGKSVVVTVTKSGGKAVFIKSDISTVNGAADLIEESHAHYGRVDLLIHCAGMLGLGSISKVSVETWQQTIDTNLNSVFYLLRKALPLMKQQGNGNVIIIGSIASQKGFPNHPAYCASKGALVPLVKQIAVDYAPHIKVNLINPGPVDTPMIWDSAKAFPDPENAVKDAAEASLLGRLANSEDIANVALFLASDASEYINGAAITVDGGITGK